MRHYLKSILITVASAYIAYRLIPTIDLGFDPRAPLVIIGGLWIISQLISPIFSLVLLPINLLTFGLVSLIINIAFIFALLNFLPGAVIGPYNFPGADIDGIILPAMNFSQIATIVLVAVIITVVQKVLHIIFE
ncbi:hypothetical protein A3A60_02685 [Candidatus Curtissbacteria bacterium RIFCSPLOWO2_01_FULL_42_26]|uniref:Phage holin family protein n=1 Tax=Candidatus Curtissbacteria bacterium RIFCSPLOWO2_01_FULL_42_26 TaxID=1797729 RepID=A0A1F5I3C1_9BACT|nr:MAG: hypothetical protein A3A60_02685 [Candidatus Curtissbacteria bacterium RIFCSPLOWO2_01_FULL_42_26]